MQGLISRPRLDMVAASRSLRWICDPEETVMADRSVVFAEYAFVVYLKDFLGAETPLGGFADAEGLPRKVPGLHKVGDVTLKRGVVADSSTLSNWIAGARSGGTTSKLDVIVTQRGAGNTPLQSWRFVQAYPTKYVGPPLGGKTSEVAIETLILSAESVEIVP
jgi:phage tail-like protein